LEWICRDFADSSPGFPIIKSLKISIMKRILFLIAIATMAIAGCKKDKPKAASLVNKWSVTNTHIVEIVSGLVFYEERYTGVAADYLDFRNDNKLYSSIDGSSEVVPYQLIGDDKVVIDGDTFVIQSLTFNSVKLYMRDPATRNTYVEATVNLKR
jgi:hypothetical protein